MLIATKLVPPSYRVKLVERPRLVDRLNEEAYRSLFLIKAPSGFGKTALLSQWRQSLLAQGCKVGWINLDDSDNEESQFLGYVMAALQQAGCDFGQGALAVYQRGEPNAAALFVTALINDLSTLDSEIYLVLEDYHCITNHEIHALLERVLTYAPTNFHLAISSRTEPPFALQQLRIHDRVTEVGIKALRFTHDETREVLSKRVPAEVSQEQSREIHDATEGWVAGIQMLSMAWRADDPYAAHTAVTAMRPQMSEAILQSTLDSMAPEVADMLQRLSIFDRFSAELCEAVIGTSNAEETLEKLAADCALLVPLDHKERWYRFHPLFADYLRRRLVARVVDDLGVLHARARAHLERKDASLSREFMALIRECRIALSAVDLGSLHLKASVWFEQHGYYIEAVQHAVGADEDEYAYDLIERCAMTVVADGDLNTVLAWLTNMPEAELSKRWRLRLAKYWAAVLSNDLRASSVDLQKLSAGVSVPNGITPFELAVCRAAFACVGEHSADVLELDELWPPSGDTFHNEVACNALSYAYSFAGRHEKVREVQAWLMENVRAPNITFAYNRGVIAWTSVIQGDLASAERMLRDAVAITEEKYGRRSIPACAVAGYLAEVLYVTNALDDLEDLLAGRLDVMNRMLFFESLVRAYVMGARVRFVRGDVHGAHDLLDRLKSYGNSKGLVRPVAAAIGERVRMALLQGDRASAQSLQSRLDGIADGYGDESCWPTLGSALEIPLTARLSRIRCMIASGDAAKALQFLDSLARLPVISERFDISIRVHILRAMALESQKEREGAEQEMGDALRLSAWAGVVRSFTDEGKSCEIVLKAISAKLDWGKPDLDGVRIHLDRILASFGSCQQPIPDTGATRREISPEFGSFKLSMRERDVLQFLAQGMPNKRIATTMNVSIDTVKWHLKNIFSKLDAADRFQAIEKARLAGLIARLP